MTICSGTGWTGTGWADADDMKVNAATLSVSLRMAGERIRNDIAVLLEFAQPAAD
jgi:hypothetical protein